MAIHFRQICLVEDPDQLLFQQLPLPGKLIKRFEYEVGDIGVGEEGDFVLMVTRVHQFGCRRVSLIQPFLVMNDTLKRI
jgi:hypothetical protein